jgi:hypothetical protein
MNHASRFTHHALRITHYAFQNYLNPLRVVIPSVAVQDGFNLRVLHEHHSVFGSVCRKQRKWHYLE